MTAALIFRRQLVRHKLYSGQQAQRRTSCHSKNFIGCLTIPSAISMPLMVTVKIGVGQLTRIIVSRRRKIFSFNEKSYISGKLSLIRIHISQYGSVKSYAVLKTINTGGFI